MLMRRGMELLRGKIVNVLRALSSFAREWRAEPTLGSTHLQPAQPTTVGKRATLWMQDLVLDLADLDHRIATLPCRGVKGTTGTQASFLEIFGGDHAKVRELDARVTRKIGFASSIPVSGQTYSRKLDAQVLGVVAGIASSAMKFSGDIRVLQSVGEIEEPFETEQIGSSAMAYKRNPMRCGAHRVARALRRHARAEREPHARRPVLRAHARRQRQPAPRDSRELSGDRRHSHPHGERRRADSRYIRRAFADASRTSCRSWRPKS